MPLFFVKVNDRRLNCSNFHHKKNLKRLFIICFILLIGHTLFAQTFGGSPASLQWRQINTDTVRIIFPKGYEAGANRIAAVIHTMQQQYGNTIGNTINKINIVIQNQTGISNGYVGLAPYRSEFYVTPPQNPFELGSINWADNLAIHEFRHVQQFSNFNKGLSKVAAIILGEQGRALANAAAIPDWFFEGDAVFNETKLSPQGRGSLPLFMRNFQALQMAGHQYSYATLRNGSLRKLIPDHYALGYLLVTYGRSQYGDSIWRPITADAAAFKPLFYPFQGAVKKYLHLPFSQFVHNAMDYYTKQWDTQSAAPIQWRTAVETNTVTNYQYPYRLNDSELVVLKTGYLTLPGFYRLHPDGTSTKIANRGIALDDVYGYNNGQIIYAAYQPDKRWGNRDYTSLRQVDITTGETHEIIGHVKYFSPDIAHNGEKVLAVEQSPEFPSRIVLLNQQGKLLQSFMKDGWVLSNPKFAADDKAYYLMARNANGEMSLLKNTINSNTTTTTLLPFANRLLGYMTVQADTIVYTTTYLGKDEVWAYIDRQKENNRFRLAGYATGLYQAVLKNDGTLLAAANTGDGFRIGQFTAAWENAPKEVVMSTLFVRNTFKDADHELLKNLPIAKYPITKYPKSFHLLNLHSYRPFYDNPEYSFTLYGQNVLNTFQSAIAYTYNQNEYSHQLSYDGVYGGSYLQPVFGLSQTFQRTAAYNKDTVFNWNETIGYLGGQLPLNFSGGHQYRYLTLATTYNVDQLRWTGLATKYLRNQSFSYINSRIQYTGQLQKTVQQIYPQWAQSILLQYKQSVNNYTAHQFLASGSLYLPGLLQNHSLVLNAAFQQRDTMRQYLFSNNFPFARGYTAVDFPVMWKFGLNYHFPLLYPDRGFGQLVYLLRVRGNLFYDHTSGKSLQSGIIYPFQTLGTEIYFDTKWWNQQPVSFGIRYSHLLNSQFRGPNISDSWELILPVNLFN